MAQCEAFIKRIENSLPELCTVRDLIKAGFWKSHQSARNARLTEDAPPFLRIGKKKIIFPKTELIQWLRRCNGDDANPMQNTADKTASLYASSRLEDDRG